VNEGTRRIRLVTPRPVAKVYDRKADTGQIVLQNGRRIASVGAAPLQPFTLAKDALTS